MSKAVVDSSLTADEVLKQNPNFFCPQEILNNIQVVEVEYYSFDGLKHRGQVAIHEELVADIKGAFELLLQEKFPVETVIPVSDHKFAWNDGLSTSANNTSAFNYRFVRDSEVMSNHSQGRAIDINPKLNPYFPGEKVFPLHASYNPLIPGTIVAGSKLVRYFEKLGWRWSGSWDEDLDYQHFEKL